MSDENLFLEHEHRESGRLAVLEDDGISVWLYIAEAASRKPLADAWVYNRIAAPPFEAIDGPAAEIDLEDLKEARRDPRVHALLAEADQEGARVEREGRNRWGSVDG